MISKVYAQFNLSHQPLKMDRKIMIFSYKYFLFFCYKPCFGEFFIMNSNLIYLLYRLQISRFQDPSAATDVKNYKK
jgi:hypothetical protein